MTNLNILDLVYSDTFCEIQKVIVKSLKLLTLILKSIF